jgi:hypothetical protein
MGGTGVVEMGKTVHHPPFVSSAVEKPTEALLGLFLD